MNDSELHLALVPQNPQARSIFLGKYDPETGDVKFDLNGRPVCRSKFLTFPHSLFGVFYRVYRQRGGKLQYQLIGLRVGFSQTPFTGALTDSLYGLPLGNSDPGFNICIYDKPAANSLKELILKTMDLYWTSAFFDYHDEYSHWLDDYGRDELGRAYRGTSATDGHINPFMKRWAAMSKKKDFSFIMKRTKMKQSDYTITVGQWVAAYQGQLSANRIRVIKNI